MKSQFLIRTTSALGLLVFLSAAFWFSVFAVVAVAAGVCLWEYSRLSTKWRWTTAWYLLYPLGFLLLSRSYLAAQDEWMVLCAVVSTVGLLALVVQDPKNAIGRWAVSVDGALYIGLSLSFVFSQNGAWVSFPTFAVLIAALAAVFIGDSAAYIVGTRYGRHRLASKVSPKKSVEGAVAHLVACALVVMVILGSLQVCPWWDGLLAGLAISVVAQAGDLFESKLKRLAGVKDASDLVPGHGGMLDRIDSLIFVIPLSAAIGALINS